MKKHLLVFIALSVFLFPNLRSYAQCTTSSGLGGTIASLPACGTSSSSSAVAYTQRIQLSGLEAGGNYTVNVAGGLGSTNITVTNSGFTAIANCSSCASLTFTAPSAGTYFAIVQNGGCPGAWSATSMTLSYARNNPGNSAPSVAYDCSNNNFDAGSGYSAYQWQGTGGTSIGGATSQTYSANSATSPQFDQYRVVRSYGSCQTNSNYVNAIPRNNYTGNITVSGTQT